MMPLLYLLLVVFLAKIVFDSPVGRALGDTIRNLAPPRAPKGGASEAELEKLRRDVEAIREELERVVEEQSFMTRLLSKPPRHISIGPGELESDETPT